MDTVSKLQELIDIHGGPEVEKAFLQLLSKGGNQTPAHIYARNLSPDYVESTLDQLDAGCSESLKAGVSKAELIKQKTTLDTEIKLIEADAFMNADCDGKKVTVLVKGKPMVLETDSMKDQWRRSITANLRRERAKVQGDLDAVTFECERIEKTNAGIRAKAELQSSMFRYLAGR